MKVTTLLLVAALPTATVVWSDLGNPASSPNAWVHPQHAYDYLKQCTESGGSQEVCACAAKHILVESPPVGLPAVAAGESEASPAIHQGYRESCERWAGILGLGDEGEAATPGAEG